MLYILTKSTDMLVVKFYIGPTTAKECFKYYIKDAKSVLRSYSNNIKRYKHVIFENNKNNNQYSLDEFIELLNNNAKQYGFLTFPPSYNSVLDGQEYTIIQQIKNA